LFVWVLKTKKHFFFFSGGPHLPPPHPKGWGGVRQRVFGSFGGAHTNHFWRFPPRIQRRTTKTLGQNLKHGPPGRFFLGGGEGVSVLNFTAHRGDPIFHRVALAKQGGALHPGTTSKTRGGGARFCLGGARGRGGGFTPRPFSILDDNKKTRGYLM